MTAGPQDVLDAVRAAHEALGPALCPSAVVGSREEWAEVLGELQGLVDRASAAQDAAIVRLAAIEPVEAEDGTVVESHRGLGHGALDAPAIVSGALSVGAVHAERRVRQALRLAGDGPAGSEHASGLGGLHVAMGAGRLDDYRAGVIARELEEAPAEVAASVVAALEGFFGTEDGPRLRRRCRRVLARVSPDLLRQRAVRARSECSLRRWVEEPGVDTWLGTFPCEDAARAWAAIDALAQQYLTDGTSERIDRARAKALTDLVAGNATIDVHVTLTTPLRPVASPAAAATAGDLLEVAGLHPGDPVLVERGWLQAAIDGGKGAPSQGSGGARVGRRDARDERRTADDPTPMAPCDPVTGALIDPDGQLDTDAYRPGKNLVALVRTRDGHCRFPGCSVTARFCDLDHVRPWPTGPTTATNLICLCRRHHRTKQRPGWTVHLHPDATATWTDPTSRQRTTVPTNHLDHVVLHDNGVDEVPTPSNPRLVLPDGPYSALEHALEHLLGGRYARLGCRVDVRGHPARRIVVTSAPWCHRRRGRPRPGQVTDPTATPHPPGITDPTATHHPPGITDPPPF